MNVLARLEALAAAPKVWRCVSVFSDGKVVNHDQPTQGMIEAHAVSQRRFLGKQAKRADGTLISEPNGRPITLDIVEVTYIGNDWNVAAKFLGCTVAELKGS